MIFINGRSCGVVINNNRYIKMLVKLIPKGNVKPIKVMHYYNAVVRYAGDPDAYALYLFWFDPMLLGEPRYGSCHILYNFLILSARHCRYAGFAGYRKIFSYKPRFNICSPKVDSGQIHLLLL